MPAWLAEATKPERVRAALVQQVPEFAAGTLVLQKCEVKRFRLRDDTGRWSGQYQFTVDGLPSGQPEVVRVWGNLIPRGLPGPDDAETLAAFGSEAWRCYVPELRLELQTQPPETKLAALPQLTDPGAARELLEQCIRACAPAYHDLHIEACSPRVVRYKPGSRCTILYQLECPAGLPAGRQRLQSVVAKTHYGDKGQNAYRAMRALWDSPLARSGSVAIAEPLAFLPELNVLVQGAIRAERTLKEFLRLALSTGTPEVLEKLRGYMRKTALGLAALHRCGVSYGETLRWEDELAEIRERNARLAVHMPQHAEATAALLPRLERLAARYPADPAGPAHRSFRPAQVLLHKEDIGFIDFDGFCQAEPALDLALFMTEVKHIGLGKLKTGQGDGNDEPQARSVRLAQLEEICGVFLDDYMTVMPVSRHRIRLWEALDLVTLLQGTWTKVKPERLDDTVFLLERHPINRDDQYR